MKTGHDYIEILDEELTLIVDIVEKLRNVKYEFNN